MLWSQEIAKTPEGLEHPPTGQEESAHTRSRSARCTQTLRLRNAAGAPTTARRRTDGRSTPEPGWRIEAVVECEVLGGGREERVPAPIPDRQWCFEQEGHPSWALRLGEPAHEFQRQAPPLGVSGSRHLAREVGQREAAGRQRHDPGLSGGPSGPEQALEPLGGVSGERRTCPVMRGR